MTLRRLAQSTAPEVHQRIATYREANGSGKKLFWQHLTSSGTLYPRLTIPLLDLSLRVLSNAIVYGHTSLPSGSLSSYHSRIAA